MKVAIIGANGFIGSRLVEQLHLGGVHQVVPVVRKPYSLALPARFSLEWRLGDALDLASLTKAVTGCDAVVHSAIGDPAQIEKMPAILCQAAAAAGVRRVVYLSSASVHGQDIAPGTTEASPLHTRHALDYNNAKVRAEFSFFKEAQRSQIAGYALRPGVVFGPRSRWIADLADDLSTDRAWLFDEGKGICNSIYVDNVVHAVLRSLEAGAGNGEAYLIGDTEQITWAQFYGSVAASLGVSMDQIQRIEKLPLFQRSFRQRVDDTMTRPWAQRLLPAIPFRLKRGVKNVIASWNPPTGPDAWSLPSPPAPRITQELALLQQCRWKFPHTKAEQTLGYRPPIAFAEGMRRSLAWLRFARGELPASP